jgi:two-component system, NarL family, response regulator LiaR
MNTYHKIRIVLAEDHLLVRQGIRHLLELSPDCEVVGESGDGEQALALVKSLHPDILLCDIRMPRLNGIDLVRQAKEYSPETRSLVLSAYDDEEYIFELMLAGASGYHLKTVDSNTLLDSIFKVYRGEAVLGQDIAAKVAKLWAARNIRKNSKKLLTFRETEILHLASKGLKNKSIAERLNLNTRTVEGYFYSINKKLSVSSRSEAILYGVNRHLIDLEESHRP